MECNCFIRLFFNIAPNRSYELPQAVNSNKPRPRISQNSLDKSPHLLYSKKDNSVAFLKKE